MLAAWLCELQIRGRSKSVPLQKSPDGLERCVNLAIQLTPFQVPGTKRMCMRAPRSTLVQNVIDDLLLKWREIGDCARQNIAPIEDHAWIYAD